MPWDEITETHIASTRRTPHALPETYPFLTPHDGILSDLNTNSYTPRAIAADGTEMRDQATIQRHNPLLFQRIVTASCGPRSW
jgi:hypothetical protein